MLSGVLLHVIESARPIDATRDRTLAHGRVEQVGNALAFVDHVADRGVAECAGVVRLAAGCRVESRMVEVHAASVVGAIHHARVEFGAVGVGVVEACGHT